MKKPGGDSTGRWGFSKNTANTWGLLLSLQDACHGAIRVLVVHKESQLGIHKIDDEIDRRRIALDEFDGHGIAAGAARA